MYYSPPAESLLLHYGEVILKLLDTTGAYEYGCHSLLLQYPSQGTLCGSDLPLGSLHAYGSNLGSYFIGQLLGAEELTLCHA